jgi:hypothetical protein
MMIMECREPYPSTTDIEHLEQVGFSDEQIARLQRVKESFEPEVCEESEALDKRFAFVRWLYQQGRLQS